MQQQIKATKFDYLKMFNLISDTFHVAHKNVIHNLLTNRTYLDESCFQLFHSLIVGPGLHIKLDCM